MKWMQEEGMKQCYLYINEDLDSIDEVCKSFDFAIKYFDPILKDLLKKYPNIAKEKNENMENLSYSVDANETENK